MFSKVFFSSFFLKGKLHKDHVVVVDKSNYKEYFFFPFETNGDAITKNQWELVCHKKS